jgi:hypothetical protein
LLSDGTWLGFLLPGAVVGALLAARRPRNPLGWLLLAIVLLAAVPASDYAFLDYRMDHGTLPLGWVSVVFVGSWSASRSSYGCSRMGGCRRGDGGAWLSS